MSAIVRFLEGKGPDGAGRSIGNVLSFDLAALERYHNYIQWLFPMREESQAVAGSPVLTDSDIDAVKGSSVAQWNVRRAVELMDGFYASTDHWLKSSDHNHLRITRIIKSLRLLVGDAAADDFRSQILARVSQAKAPISETSRSYWASA
jgi:hypothetical protein